MKKLLTLFMVLVLAFTNINVNADTTEGTYALGSLSIQERLGKPDLNILDSVTIEFKDEKGAVTTDPKLSAKAAVDFTWSITNEDAENIQAGDLAITSDIPLANDILDKGGKVLTKQ